MRNDVVIEKLILTIEKIERYCGDLTYEDFLKSDMLAEACIFNLSQIGELSNKIEKEYALIHPKIPWRQLYGLRNRIVHDYEGVNLKLVWEIIAIDLPKLKNQLKEL